MSATGLARRRGPFPVSDRIRAAVRLVEEGQSRREVAELYGVDRKTLGDWILRVEDERRLAGLRP